MISWASTGQMSLHSALKKVRTTTFPLAPARVQVPPRLVLQGDGRGLPAGKTGQPDHRAGGGVDGGRVGSGGGDGGRRPACRGAPWGPPVPANVVIGVATRAPTPALPMSFSATIPPSPSTAKATMTQQDESAWHGNRTGTESGRPVDRDPAGGEGGRSLRLGQGWPDPGAVLAFRRGHRPVRRRHGGSVRMRFRGIPGDH